MNPRLYLAIAAAALVSRVAWGQMDFDFPAPGSGSAPTNRPPLLHLSFTTSYTIPSETKYKGTRFNDSSAFNYNFGAGLLLPLSDRWILPLEIGSSEFALDSVPGVPLPNSIHTLTLGSGLGFRPNEEWILLTRIGATLYKFDDVRSNDFGLSGALFAVWRYNPSLRIVLGALVSPDSDLPALPLAGFDWAIDAHWQLKLVLPQPSLVYKLNDSWHLHVGADLVTATFRTPNAFGNSLDRSQYNDALGTYRDIRVGGGLSCQITHNVNFDFNAGYSVNRQIDYSRIDDRVKFEPGPYVEATLRTSF